MINKKPMHKRSILPCSALMVIFPLFFFFLVWWKRSRLLSVLKAAPFLLESASRLTGNPSSSFGEGGRTSCFLSLSRKGNCCWLLLSEGAASISYSALSLAAFLALLFPFNYIGERKCCCYYCCCALIYGHLIELWLAYDFVAINRYISFNRIVDNNKVADNDGFTVFDKIS